MIDFMNLNAEELAKADIAFETKKEVQAFAAMILEKLQVRIGTAITEEIGKAKAAEFEECSDEDAGAWLRKNCPDYQDIVAREKEKLEQELIEFCDRIPGRVPVIPDLDDLDFDDYDDA